MPHCNYGGTCPDPVTQDASRLRRLLAPLIGVLEDGALVPDSDFSHDVQEAFHGLLDRGGLRVESSIYSRRDFGNASVVFAAPEFRLRLSRDRGEIDAEISSSRDPEDWYSLEWVIAAVTGTSPPEPRTVSPRYAAGLVEAHFDEIRAGLAGPSATATKLKLEAFGEDRMRDLEGEDWRSRC